MLSSRPWLVRVGFGLVALLATRAMAVLQPGANSDGAAATGIRLTRSGLFAEAIPYLQQASGTGGSGRYVIDYDLALCYFGLARYAQAISELEGLRSARQDNAAVNKLLAQVYVSAGQPVQALAAFARAQAQAPQDEKLYDFLADACNDHGEYALGLGFVEAGLKALPISARLHYERGLFLAQLDRLDEALPAFARATALAPSSDVGVLAAVQSAFYQNQFAIALKLVRQAIADGHRDARMEALLGTVLLRTGVVPGDQEFAEARQALEASVATDPQAPDAQLALGKLYLMQGNAAAAKDHLEAAQRLAPRNASVYASLAAAYGRLGMQEDRRRSLTTLSTLAGQKGPAYQPTPP